MGNYSVGDTVGNNYLLKENLGGRQNLTFRASGKTDSKNVVIKFFLNSLSDETSRKMYESEMKVREVTGDIPGILKILEHGEINGDHYIVTEFVKSGSLSDFLKKNSNGVSLEEVLRIFGPIAEALDQLHAREIIHRDIKPQNILLEKTKDECQIFITDFGLAKFVDSSEKFMTDSVAGTAQYIAPEAFTVHPKTLSIDNYSFGIMLYTAFEGKEPFEKSRMPSEYGPAINEPIPYPERTRQRYTKGVADLILWAMSDDPNERPGTAGEVINLFKKIYDHPEEDEKKWIGRKFNNYIVLDMLYKGRVSPTLLALDIRNKKQVVLKTFDKDSLTGDAKATYQNEMRSLGRLNKDSEPNRVREHHILTPNETFEQDGIFFIVSDYQSNGTLRTLMKSKPPLNVLLDIFTQIAEAIDFVHSNNLVHRDIKPENIVYQKYERKYHIFLTDFGIAKILDHSSTSYSTQLNSGTKFYMAPECWKKGARKTKAVDIYAFGIMLYETFEGDVPFKGTEEQLIEQHLNAQVPAFKNKNLKLRPNAQNLIINMLAKNPNLRPKSAGKEIKKLSQILTTPVDSREIGSVPLIRTDPTKPVTEEVHLPKNGKIDNKPKTSIFSRTAAFFAIGAIIVTLLSTGVFSGILPRTTPTPTPTLQIFSARVSQPSFCHNGPNANYLGATILSAGKEVEVLAMNTEGDWFMIRYDGSGPCWMKATALTFPPNIDLENLLRFVTVITLENAPCLIYPSTRSTIQTVIPKDWRIVAYGKSNPDATWVLVVPHNSTELCWVAKTDLSVFSVSDLPIEAVDIALTPTSTSTLISTSNLTSTLTLITTSTLSSTPTRTRQPVTPTNTRRSGGNNNPTSTHIPPTPIPPTPVPPTPVPPTPVPPTPIPPTPKPPDPTATLCWPPGHCK